MSLKEQLPKLGKEEKHGTCDLFEHEFTKIVFIRPDYNQFKGRIYNTGEECVAVLSGMTQPSVIYNLYDEKMALLIEENPTTNDRMKDQRWIDCMQITSIFEEIREVFNIGIERKKIDVSRTRNGEHYHSLSFLHWMQENSFPIPDELSFREKKDGALHWIENGEISKEKPADPNKKWVECCIKFSKAEKKKKDQYPRGEDVELYLEKLLKNEGEKLGKHKALPNSKFREIYNDKRFEKYKRAIGEKTK